MGTRSKVTLNNLQEVSQSGGDLRKGLAQYLTPHEIAAKIQRALFQHKGRHPSTVIDPQAGERALLRVWPYTSQSYGVDIQEPKSHLSPSEQPRHLTADCRKFGEIVDDMYPRLRWECGVANFPFNLPWKGEKPCEWTWRFLQEHTSYGAMIGPDDEKMQALMLEDSVWGTETLVWPDADVTVRVIYYDTEKQATPQADLGILWTSLAEAVKEETARTMPEFNVWLKDSKLAGRSGTIGVYLSVRDRVNYKLGAKDAKRLMELDGNIPQVLAVDRETRVLLRDLVDKKIYRIQPAAQEAIERALDEAKDISVPIMPVTDFERVAYLDEEEMVKCVKDWEGFEKGKTYSVKSRSYTFRHTFTRKKPHFNEKTHVVEQVEHECRLSGQDKEVVVTDRTGRAYVFRSSPEENQYDESKLWEYFARPEVRTVAERWPDKVARNRLTLEGMEIVADFNFFAGQVEYLSRALVKDGCLIAAETGTGKSLMALSAYVVKGAKRCLIVCPKGTVRSNGEEDDLSQWVSEIQRFAPHCEVFEMFSQDDYERICRLNGGELPPGFYVTYYDAFFTNRSVENCSWANAETPRWSDLKLAEMVYPDMSEKERKRWDSQSEDVITLGKEVNGIRCIAKPSLSTLIGHEFDMVCLDEAHNIKTMTANRTQAAIRLPARYRFCFTATPVPNIASDIFPLMGWVCVDDWYKGGVSNAAWPFRREDLPRFESIFLSKERDFTAEMMVEMSGGKSRKIEKTSPVLSSPARLLKILKPSIAYITKGQCNRDYLPPRIVDIRVPLGKAQAKLYGHFANLGNISMTIARRHVTNPLVRAGAQIEWLRTICTDPCHASVQAYKGAISSFNPKVLSIMELTIECLNRGEQVVIVNSRMGISDTIHRLLEDAGVSVSRIDSSERSGNHSEESNLFKRGHTQVMLMGIKCAVGHSYDQCRNLIIGSLEYSPGPFEQARGRVDRLTSQESQIYCILCKNTIEEVMFDTVATKEDASRIILKGQRVPRDFMPVDMSEVLLDSILKWDSSKDESVEEATCFESWETLKEKLQ